MHHSHCTYRWIDTRDREMFGDCHRLELCLHCRLQIVLLCCDMMTQSPLSHRSTTPRFPEDCDSSQIVLQSLIMLTVGRSMAATMIIAYCRRMISRKAFTVKFSFELNRQTQPNCCSRCQELPDKFFGLGTNHTASTEPRPDLGEELSGCMTELLQSPARNEGESGLHAAVLHALVPSYTLAGSKWRPLRLTRIDQVGLGTWESKSKQTLSSTQHTRWRARWSSVADASDPASMAAWQACSAKLK